jgi:hypothetical protein
MNQRDICQDFSGGLPALFECRTHGEYQRIRTPYLYPDGDNIDVFCKSQSDLTVVTDLGETTRWLRMQTISPRRSPKQKALIEDVCLTHGVEFYKGMLLARCHPGDQLSAVVCRVAQAALRVSDLWFTFRTRSVESVTDEVADFLTERELQYGWAGRGRAQAAAVPAPAAGRDRQARRHRRAAQRRQARPRSTWTCSTARRRRATPRPRSGSRPTSSASPGSCATARTRPAALDLWPVHQRPAGRHVRAEEPADQADGRGRVQQYKRDRDPKELLFQFGRCMVHFAVDDHEVRMCTT